MVRFDSPSPHWSTGPKITAQVMDYLKEIAPGCDFIAMNFNIRLTNRQMEVDGLKKAKSILQGAEY